ncbi:hypothetical protein EGW08_010549 [Elysia chlorotica]|uniref:Uncharacterized protein n=1 Tax=Elysia chlorotica TaxID=188477 RepID=A0A3S1BDU2_ELYCH|nr:hypothetical protein EGW08_010549 [Elysia chlorotica]
MVFQHIYSSFSLGPNPLLAESSQNASMFPSSSTYIPSCTMVPGTYPSLECVLLFLTLYNFGFFFYYINTQGKKSFVSFYLHLHCYRCPLYTRTNNGPFFLWLKQQQKVFQLKTFHIACFKAYFCVGIKKNQYKVKAFILIDF